MDFRAFFLLVKAIIQIRQNLIFKSITARRSLLVVGETSFPANGNHFFSPFFRDSSQFFSV